MPLHIHSRVLDQMIRHSRRELPLECCGLLTGVRELIDGVVPTTNERRSPTEFSIPPRQLFAFFKKLRKESREFQGIYHSHPRTEARPSQRDCEEFYYPEVSYWIVSLKDDRPDIRCFRWSKMGFCEIRYEVGNYAHEQR
ncbi:MAG: Mov34/MPN/PAD-1 family protein [Acidobacteriota bacterium]